MEKKVRFTFKKSERLSKAREFRNVFDNGESIAGKLMVIYYVRNDVGYPRAGFIVSKKVSKRAVDRNRAKRLMREVFRLRKHQLAPFDIVFIARKGIISSTYWDVEKEFLNLAGKSGLLRKEDA